MKTNQTRPDLNSTLGVGHRMLNALLPPACILHSRSFIVVLLLVLSLSAAHLRAATNTVLSLVDAGPGSLREAIAESAAGDTIVFAVTGSISLSSGELVLDKDLTIAGPSLANLTISGNQASRVFLVQTNAAITVAHLTIANGLSTNGGGIYNDRGIVVLLDTILESNIATNSSGDACGGGVFNGIGGVINATNCRFVLNEASGGDGSAAMVYPVVAGAAAGCSGRGGAVFSAGEFNSSRCSFVQNRVLGGTGGAGLNYMVPFEPEWSFSGAGGGASDGGAICNHGKIVIEQSVFATNTAAGGRGGFGAYGGQAYPCGPYFFGTSGGGGGNARGAAVCNEGEASLVNCTLAWNTSTGGPGADGATGGEMYCHGAGFTAGGQGGGGGRGFGAIFSENQPLLLLNCTLARNSGIGGAGGASGGGGYYTFFPPDDPEHPVTTIWPAPPAGMDGIGVGGIAQSGSLLNTLLAFNSPVNGQPTLADLGFNLSSDTSCLFTNEGSLNDTDPKLGSLADNSGATLTMALLPGSPAIDAGDTAAAPSTDQRGIPRPYGLAADIGAFEFQAHYVSPLSSNPVPPYESWVTAARTIQDAMDAATVPGALIVVSNGVYGPLEVAKPLSIQGVNGAGVTLIHGGGSHRCATLSEGVTLTGFTLTAGSATDGGGAYGGSLSQCILATNSATWRGGGGCLSRLSDCTLEGNTAVVGGGAYGGVLTNCTLAANSAQGGGGDNASVLVNCTLSNNVAQWQGGGVFEATLKNCMLLNNSAVAAGGGAFASTLEDCTLKGNVTGTVDEGQGGGAAGSTLTNCAVVENTAFCGGGVAGCTLDNCMVSQNTASWTRGIATFFYGGEGGGANGSTLNNCIVFQNEACYGGGVYKSTLNNCTASWNTARQVEDYFGSYGGDGGGAFESALTNCIVALNFRWPEPDSGTDVYGGDGWSSWIGGDPLFVAWWQGDLRLQSNSPCINAGNNAYAVGPTDLDGNPRIVSGTVDIGAYEYQGAGSWISYAWLQQYGLPTDGSADYLDQDHDGQNNWQEWRCDTNPTNALSALRLSSAAPAGTNIIVTWQSIEGVTYFLERSTNLAGPPPLFTPLATNIPGQPGTTSFTDTGAAQLAPLFYRVGVK